MRKAIALVALVACNGSSGVARADAAPDQTAADCGAPASPPSADCSLDAGTCSPIDVGADPPSLTSGNFRGYGDPSFARDPAGPLWLAYSYLHATAGAGVDGGAVVMAAVDTHLARSDDDGKTFDFVADVWPSTPLADPEGSGEKGLENSETPAIASLASGGATTWFGAHLRYFQQPISGYAPKYLTSWRVGVAAASSPSALGAGPETILGVKTTSPAYAPDVVVNDLPNFQAVCEMLNNPTLFVQNGTLYLVVECLVFTAQGKIDFATSTMQVLATTPSGAPKTWTWRYVGTLADLSLAQELGADTIQQPDVAVAKDGSLLLIVTPANASAQAQVGTLGDGCVALGLQSLDPPVLARDCAGKLVVRARVTGAGPESCAYDATSVTGLVPHIQLPATPFSIRASGVSP